MREYNVKLYLPCGRPSAGVGTRLWRRPPAAASAGTSTDCRRSGCSGAGRPRGSPGADGRLLVAADARSRRPRRRRRTPATLASAGKTGVGIFACMLPPGGLMTTSEKKLSRLM